MAITTVGVLGLGQMGTGVLQVFAQSGYQVIGVESDQDQLDRAMGSIDKRLSSRVEKGKMPQEDKDNIMGRITVSTKMDDLGDCDLVEEAVPEDMELKKSSLETLIKFARKRRYLDQIRPVSPLPTWLWQRTGAINSWVCISTIRHRS